MARWWHSVFAAGCSVAAACGVCGCARDLSGAEVAPPRSSAEASGHVPDAIARVPSVLVFSKTEQYRHAVIGDGTEALRQLAIERGWVFAATEDATVFSDAQLADVNVVVFFNTTGDVLDAVQQGAVERFIQAGNGFVGIHAATDTEYDWPWYGELVGARFKEHPAIQPATVQLEDAKHVATAHLSATWMRPDEWYGFQQNPRSQVHVLLTLDESSYEPESSAMGDHPIAWLHEYDGGRAFYTAMGHTAESYQDADFLQHLAGGILWASGN